MVTYLKQTGTPAYWTYHLLRFWRSLAQQGEPEGCFGVIRVARERNLNYGRFTICGSCLGRARYASEGEKKKWQI